MCLTSENPAAIENTFNFIGLFWTLCVTLTVYHRVIYLTLSAVLETYCRKCHLVHLR